MGQSDLIRQHTFAMLVVANHALHLAHIEFHRQRDEHAVAPTPDNNASMLAARERLVVAKRIRDEAQGAVRERDNLDPWFMRLP